MRTNHSKDRNRLSFFPSTFEVILCTTLLANLAFILLQTFVSIFFHQTGSGKKGLLHYIHFPPGWSTCPPASDRAIAPWNTCPPEGRNTFAPLHGARTPVFPRGVSQGIPQWDFPRELSSWTEDRHLTPSRRTCPP